VQKTTRLAAALAGTKKFVIPAEMPESSQDVKLWSGI